MIAWLKSLGRPKKPPAGVAGVVVAESPAEPAAAPRTLDIPTDKIAQRAYEKWVNAGRPHGTADRDWAEATAELRAEYARYTAEPLPTRPR